MATKKQKITAARAQAWADTERFRQLANAQEEADKEGWRLNKAWSKDPTNFDKMGDFTAKFREADDLKEQIEEHEPFNMTALMKSAVRKHGMPKKKKKSRGVIFTREQAAKLQKTRKR